MQVGDPFMEKLVCEACLELLATVLSAGIQDMGEQVDLLNLRDSRARRNRRMRPGARCRSARPT